MHLKRVSLLALVLGFCAIADGADLRKKVLIIGMDGTRPDALPNAQIPNVSALMSNGCYSLRAVTDPITHSAACWSSMFTGVWGDKHRVQDPGNSYTGNRFDLYPSFFRRLEQFNSALSTVGYGRWSPLTNSMGGADVLQNYGSDAALATAAINRLANFNPDVFYLVFLDIDSAGHSSNFNPANANYLSKIAATDTHIGNLLNAVTNRPTYAQEDWLIIVLSDHGAHDGTVEETRITFHVVSGPSAARGVMHPAPSIVDVCATVFAHLGVPIDPDWNLDARVEGLAASVTRFGANLILNPDAEFNSATNNYAPNRGIAYWSDTESVTLAAYGANANFPSTNSPGSGYGGRNFFLGGTNSTSRISQTLDVADVAAQIDDPGVDFALSGWFGGASSENDSARLTARFLAADRSVLDSVFVGDVTAAERNSVTGLRFRDITGALPVGTRLIEFVLSMQAASGLNDGSADNLAFVLTARSDPAVSLSAYDWSGPAWEVNLISQTNRHYSLQRSMDLRQWLAVTPELPGTGNALSLTDTNPPLAQAFYRVQCRR